MAVKRIIANIATPHPEAARTFYCDILGLEAVMDHGWIITFAAPAIDSRPQVSIASEGGSGTAVPDLSVEVDNLEEVPAARRKSRNKSRVWSGRRALGS